MSIAAISFPAVPGQLAAPELRAASAAAASFLQVLEDELLHEAVPASLPPPNLPLLPPASLPPDVPWLPMPLVLLLPREEKTARKRPPARKDRQQDRQPGRR